MAINDENLKVILNNLYIELCKTISNSKEIELCKKESNLKLILAKAVSLGMKYQEEKIKEGINIVFENLSLPNE